MNLLDTSNNNNTTNPSTTSGWDNNNNNNNNNNTDATNNWDNANTASNSNVQNVVNNVLIDDDTTTTEAVENNNIIRKYNVKNEKEKSLPAPIFLSGECVQVIYMVALQKTITAFLQIKITVTIIKKNIQEVNTVLWKQ